MIEQGKTVIMKKAHPCGGAVWEIVRVGVDVKLQCKTCGKYINLTRDEVRKRIKTQPKEKE